MAVRAGKFGLPACASLCLCALLGASAAGPAQAKEVVVIGVPTFLSGPAAGSAGIPACKGVELVIIDESGGPARQVVEYRNLVQRREVDLVMGYTSSGGCEAIAPERFWPVGHETACAIAAVTGSPRGAEAVRVLGASVPPKGGGQAIGLAAGGNGRTARRMRFDSTIEPFSRNASWGENAAVFDVPRMWFPGSVRGHE